MVVFGSRALVATKPALLMLLLLLLVVLPVHAQQSQQCTF